MNARMEIDGAGVIASLSLECSTVAGAIGDTGSISFCPAIRGQIVFNQLRRLSRTGRPFG
jgi:hypothetical protein